MKLEQTVPKEILVKNGVYHLWFNGSKKEMAVFSHIGQTGLPIFHPIGEPSFQDIFALKGYGEKWIAIFDHYASPNELGI